MSSMEATREVLASSVGSWAGKCETPYEQYPIAQYEAAETAYFENLVELYMEYMYYVELRLIGDKDFVSSSCSDVYDQNMYCMSWFYDGGYPFDQWELNYEDWLYERVFSTMSDM